jgi:signal transduction histidine kinase
MIGEQPALRVSVTDNGPGLNAEQRTRIFDPFFTTKTKGTGLGMAIAKRIVEAHGGVIAVGSSPASGAEILIDLPRECP